jgi:hypothetical protein
MAKAGQIVTLTLTPDQSKQFASVLGAPDMTLVNTPANRVEVEGYEGASNASIMLHLRVVRLLPKRKAQIRNPLKHKMRKPSRRRRA